MRRKLLFILMFVASVDAIGYDNQNIVAMFIITLVFVAALAVNKLVEKNINLKAFLLYIPLGVILLLTGISEDIMLFMVLFNIVVAANIASPKSVFKKLLSVVFLLALTELVGQEAQADEFASVFIYFSSVVFTLASLFTPNKKVEITEGGDDNE